MLKPMRVSLVAVDSSTNSPVVVLKELEGEKTLPIWIGSFEATAIAMELEGSKSPRPLTHDLLRDIMELLDGKVTKVEICDLKDSIYYALIYIHHNGEEFSVDARPSDALALSLRVNAPVYVAEDIIEKSGQIKVDSGPDEELKEPKGWRTRLEDLTPDDL